jgi:hypothetical protein
MSAYTTEEDFIPAGDERSMSLSGTLRDLAVVCLINLPLQIIVTDLSLGAIAAGMLALYVVCLVGVVLTKFVPFYLPSVAWISLVGIAATLPFLPWGPWFTGVVDGIDFLAMAVPALAYAGLAVSKLELEVMRRSGLKLLLVAVLVFIGTYVGSAAIADLMLWLT